MDGGRGGKQAGMVRERHLILRAIRDFFYHRGYLEVETPCIGRTAPPDPYIEPLKVHVGERGPFYLHTSPEIGMKKLLGRGYDKIFQVCKAFRVEEFEEHHAVEFTMLEWYREGTYLEAMEETAGLIGSLSRLAPGEAGAPAREVRKIYTLSELFREATGIDPLPLGRDALFSAMRGRAFRGLTPEDTWEDLFFKLFVQEVEPRVRERREDCFIKDWPASLTAMAGRKDEHTVERFELYMAGLEIANGYTELLDTDEQRARFARDNAARVSRGKEAFPPDEDLLDALGRIRGPVAGVSVGVDRLLMVLYGKESIGDVLADRFTAGP